MLTTRVYIPIALARRLNIVCGADTNGADVKVEYIAPDASATTIATLNLTANGTDRHRVNQNHAAFASGHGLIRLEATNPNPNNFYSFLAESGNAFPVSGTAFLSSAFRVPYLPVASGNQKIRVAIANPNTSAISVAVENLASGTSTNLNLAPLTTALWDSEALSEVVNSNSAVRILSTGGDAAVAAVISRNNNTFNSYPAGYGT
jgi:hypothetical protein